MNLMRTVQAEVLDGLAADDPAAVHARADLRRIHRFMGTKSIVCRALDACLPQGNRPVRILELGAGDGSLLLRVAQTVATRWPQSHVCLLDREPAVQPATLDAFGALGWTAAVAPCDVIEWTASAGDSGGGAAGHWDLILANLFLHHFGAEALAPLLRAVQQRCRAFVAVEPRRSRLALLASYCVGALGANAVTREDAVLSVRAGFRGAEISACWDAPAAHWNLEERPAGLFSHCFVAAQRAPVLS
jgi:hypothetical protein